MNGGTLLSDIEITIYTTKVCPFCIRAKQLLDELAFPYREIAVDGNPGLRREMAEKAGQTSVPQIWISGEHIGGCNELFDAYRAGYFEQL